MNANHQTPPNVLIRTKSVKIGETQLTVREMTWPHTFRLLQVLSSYASALVSKTGKFEFDPAKIADLIIGTQELSELLILNSCDLKADDLKQLSFADGLEILDAAMEVNLNPETMARSKKVVGRLGQALGVKLTAAPMTTPLQTASISSSGKDTDLTQS